MALTKLPYLKKSSPLCLCLLQQNNWDFNGGLYFSLQLLKNYRAQLLYGSSSPDVNATNKLLYHFYLLVCRGPFLYRMFKQLNNNNKLLANSLLK